MMPFKIAGFYLKEKETGKILERDYSLFPMAKMIVQPVFEENVGLGSVSPRWLIDDNDQPDWLERFRDATNSTHGKFDYSRIFANQQAKYDFRSRWSASASAILQSLS